jgi:hypothetical protein
VSGVRDLIGYLLAFAAGMSAVATLPRLRVRARARGDQDRRGGRAADERADRLTERRLAVAVWAVGCLLTGALAAMVATLAA